MYRPVFVEIEILPVTPKDLATAITKIFANEINGLNSTADITKPLESVQKQINAAYAELIKKLSEFQNAILNNSAIDSNDKLVQLQELYIQFNLHASIINGISQVDVKGSKVNDLGEFTKDFLATKPLDTFADSLKDKYKKDWNPEHSYDLGAQISDVFSDAFRYKNDPTYKQRIIMNINGALQDLGLYQDPKPTSPTSSASKPPSPKPAPTVEAEQSAASPSSNNSRKNKSPASGEHSDSPPRSDSPSRWGSGFAGFSKKKKTEGPFTADLLITTAETKSQLDKMVTFLNRPARDNSVKETKLEPGLVVSKMITTFDKYVNEHFKKGPGSMKHDKVIAISKFSEHMKTILNNFEPKGDKDWAQQWLNCIKAEIINLCYGVLVYQGPGDLTRDLAKDLTSFGLTIPQKSLKRGDPVDQFINSIGGLTDLTLKSTIQERIGKEKPQIPTTPRSGPAGP